MKSPIFTNTPCKSTCLYNAPSLRTLDLNSLKDFLETLGRKARADFFETFRGFQARRARSCEWAASDLNVSCCTLVRPSGKERHINNKQVCPVTVSVREGGGFSRPSGQGSNDYVLRAEPKEHKHFRPGTRPGGWVIYVPFLAARPTYHGKPKHLEFPKVGHVRKGLFSLHVGVFRRVLYPLRTREIHFQGVARGCSKARCLFVLVLQCTGSLNKCNLPAACVWASPWWVSPW